MSAAIDQIRAWATEDRAQAEAKRHTVATVADQVAAIEYLAAVGANDANAAQARAQAEELKVAGNADEAAASALDATAAGWDAFADAAEKADQGNAAVAAGTPDAASFGEGGFGGAEVNPEAAP